MRIVIVAVGHRQPAWVNEAFNDYARRMPHAARIELIEVKPEPRISGKTPMQLMQAEAQRIRAVLPQGAQLVTLDGKGKEFDSGGFARWLAAAQSDGRDLAMVIGGADGLADEIKARADTSLALSRFTLPHGLARVVLAEQLYRAVSLLANHPYHRE
jgi:23S rRNA (pseudouridine1915-N3)-methyltransferase